MIKGLLLLLCALQLFAVNGTGQNAGEQPAALISKVPFTLLTGGIVILRATVGDQADSLNFVLDTGSGGISLDSSTVEYLRLPTVESDRTIRGIAGIRKVKYVTNMSLNLPGVTTDHLNFHINDYDILTSVYGVRIDGIIGFSFLNRYIVKVNYDTHIMEVWEPGRFTYPRDGYLINPLLSSIPVIEANIKDGNTVDASFYLDTGAGLSLLLSEAFATDTKVIKKGRKMTLTQAEGLGGKKPMYLTTVKRIKFGPFRFRKVPTHIFVDEFNVTAYPVLGGLLGNDIFRRFNLVINYPAKEIHFLPNSHYSDGFDYSYTGMGIYYVNGEIIIEDVLEGSPAEMAGLKGGDRILAIGNNFSNNIQSYKNMLQVPGAKIKMIVIRDGQPININLKVRSIK